MTGIWAAAVVAQGLLAQAPMAPVTTGDLALDTFRAACAPHRQDHAAMNAALAQAGWVRVEETDHPELAAAQAVVRAEMDDPDMPETRLEQVIWARTVEGRRFHVVTSRMEAMIGQTRDEDGDGIIQDRERARPFRRVSCGLWDFDATTPVTPGAMTVWTASLPVQTFDLPGQMIGGTWNVHDMMPGTGEIHVGFIPESSPFVERVGFSGVSITQSSAPMENEAASSDDGGPIGPLYVTLRGDYVGRRLRVQVDGRTLVEERLTFPPPGAEHRYEIALGQARTAPVEAEIEGCDAIWAGVMRLKPSSTAYLLIQGCEVQALAPD